jgi:hypothetical protein
MSPVVKNIVERPNFPGKNASRQYCEEGADRNVNAAGMEKHNGSCPDQPNPAELLFSKVSAGML